MPSDFIVKHQLMEELVHGLMQMKTQARNIVNGAESYMPVAYDNAKAELQEIIGHALKIEMLVKALYERNAKAAFAGNGESQTPHA